MSFSSISSAALACGGLPLRRLLDHRPWRFGCWAFCGFFLPLAGCVLELSSRYPQEGGLYIWTREAYGEFAGFMAAWTYWMSNLPYFAAVLYFAASSLLFTTPRAAHLADANVYFLLFTIGMLTLITVLNVLGLGMGKWLNNLGAVGMGVPVVILILLGAAVFFALWVRYPLHLGWRHSPCSGEGPHLLVDDFFCVQPAANALRSWAMRSRTRGGWFPAPW